MTLAKGADVVLIVNTPAHLAVSNEGQPFNVGCVLTFEGGVPRLHQLRLGNFLLQVTHFLHQILPPGECCRDRRFRLLNPCNKGGHLLLHINALKCRHLFLQCLLFLSDVADLPVHIFCNGFLLCNADFLFGLLILLGKIGAVHQI